MEPNQFNQPSFQTPLPNATPVLVLGIVSIVGCFCYGIIGLICGIVALVLAQKDLALYAQNPSAYTPGSYSNLKAGRVCGIIGLCLSALTVICLIIEILVVGVAVLTNPGSAWH
jgi:hypothetical protein